MPSVSDHLNQVSNCFGSLHLLILSLDQVFTLLTEYSVLVERLLVDTTKQR